MASVAGRGTSEHIEAILKANGIDPDKVCPNGQTAFEYLEGAIGGALDTMDEDTGDDDDEED